MSRHVQLYISFKSDCRLYTLYVQHSSGKSTELTVVHMELTLPRLNTAKPSHACMFQFTHHILPQFRPICSLLQTWPCSYSTKIFFVLAVRTQAQHKMNLLAPSSLWSKSAMLRLLLAAEGGYKWHFHARALRRGLLCLSKFSVAEKHFIRNTYSIFILEVFVK